MFSILIPAYNQELYIEQCLDSITTQSFQDYEIILMNDGSTDRTLELCEAYKKKCPQLQVITQKNQGLIMARKNALMYATHEYVIYLDSDDYFMGESLAKIAKAIEENHPDAVFYNAGINGEEKNFFEVNLPANTMISAEGLQTLRELAAGTNRYNSIWSKCFKRKLINSDIVYDGADVVSMGEDVYQILPLIDAISNVYYIDEPLYAYRLNEQSMTHKWKSAYYESMLQVIARRIEYGKKWNVPQNAMNNVIGDCFFGCMEPIMKSPMSFKERYTQIRKLVKNDLYKKYHDYGIAVKSKKLKMIIDLADWWPWMAASIAGFF